MRSSGLQQVAVLNPQSGSSRNKVLNFIKLFVVLNKVVVVSSPLMGEFSL
jgi:hypothetical protein